MAHTTPTSKDIASAPQFYTEAERWRAVAGNLAQVLGTLAVDPRLDGGTQIACATAFVRQCEAHGVVPPGQA